MSRSTAPQPQDIARLRALARLQGHGCYLGRAGRGPLFGPPEQCTLVLGPPRSGKTRGVVVPNVLAAAGVVAVSTKRDVLDATSSERSRVGPCFFYDPSGALEAPAALVPVGWSPLHAAGSWPGAVAVAEAMVGAARPQSWTGESAHWSERAAALLAPLLHAAALEGAPLEELVAWVNRREPERALAVLAGSPAELALDLLAGIAITDGREQSGIWSTASSVLAAYRTEPALASAERTPAPLDQLLAGSATLYVVASAEHQRHCAPLVAGLVREVRSAAYALAARPGARSAGGSPPLLLVLDELANIAPLHDLPELISEGGSQGLLTLACLQDLSQARGRWGNAADGFLSLFGAKLVLGGLGDVRTLEALSLLAGEHQVPLVSRTRSREPGSLQRRSSRTLTTRTARRLPPHAVASPPPGTALLLQGARPFRVELPALFPGALARSPRRGPARVLGGR